MGEKYKKNKGNQFAHNQEFAEEVEAKNVKRAGQNNPSNSEQK
jgi:hypothetical protein